LEILFLVTAKTSGNFYVKLPSIKTCSWGYGSLLYTRRTWGFSYEFETYVE
jgi:hypothetical protein